MQLHESAEMYLETILVLQNRTGFVRSIDLANEMKLSKPSVSRACSLLRENGYLNVADGGQLLLTELGRSVAQKVYERHQILTSFLTSLGVSRETAEQDACRIEHVISDEAFEQIKTHLGRT